MVMNSFVASADRNLPVPKASLHLDFFPTRVSLCWEMEVALIDFHVQVSQRYGPVLIIDDAQPIERRRGRFPVPKHWIVSRIRIDSLSARCIEEGKWPASAISVSPFKKQEIPFCPNEVVALPIRFA